MLWVNDCRGGRLRSSRADDHLPQKFPSCTPRRPSTTRCDPNRIFNSYLSHRRRSLIGADDGNRALSSLRPSPGFGVFQNGPRCPRRRTNHLSILISSLVPAVPSHFSSRSATQTSCHAFHKAIPSNQPTLIRTIRCSSRTSPRRRRSRDFVPFLCTGGLALFFITLYILLVEDDSNDSEMLVEQES